MDTIDDPDRIVVVSACDDAYAMPCAVMLSSLFANLDANEGVRIAIIDAGTSAATRRKISAVAERHSKSALLSWHRPDVRAFHSLRLPALSKWTMCPRLTLAENLPEAYERVVYLDADLVVEGDLRRLWQHEIGDFHVLAVRDFGHPSLSSGLSRPRTVNVVSTETFPYFNSGVMVVNLRRWRLDGTGARALEYLRRFGDLCRYPDQDPLNAVCADVRPACEVLVVAVPSGTSITETR